jgi:hypothetical protein
MAKGRKLNHNLDGLLDTFGVTKVLNCTQLEEWESSNYVLNEREKEVLETKRALMREEGDLWNEEELKMHFLAFLFDIAEINVKGKVKLFYERPLSALIQGTSLTVICDCFVATPFGINSPKHPYFFLQEFKKGKGSDHDPEAQMLAAMLIAQEINRDEKPTYGAFIVGKNWNFATLTGRDYCVGNQYDSSKAADLFKIIYMLRQLKPLILNR